MKSIKLKLLDQDEAKRTVARLNLTDEARVLMQAIIDEVWLGHSFRVSYFSDWYSDNAYGLTKNKTKKALDDLATIGLLAYEDDLYFISIKGFFEFRRSLPVSTTRPVLRTREELKSLLKVVVSN
jgi:hypothetical protein